MMSLPTSPRRTRRAATVLVAAAALALAPFAVSSASADVAPSTPLAAPVADPFLADACAGATDLDPTDSGEALTNLLSVEGGRLAAYNAGAVVPLYDSYGAAEGPLTGPAAYPPLCGTRAVVAEDGTQRAVSQWMYCTDLASKVCGGVDEDGNLHDGHEVLDPMSHLTRNDRLTAEQERLVAYLVQTGHPYTGVGEFDYGVTVADSSSTTNRDALQMLVWCISDPATGAGDRAATCEASLPAAEQARLLALIPETPTAELTVTGSGGTFTVGQTARVTLTTNVYESPLTLGSTAAGAAAFTLCTDATNPAGAVIDGGVLRIPVPADAAESTTVTLCVTRDTPGTGDLTVSVTPPSTSHIGWNQSRTDGGPTCQVFATFNETERVTLAARASATFVAVPTDVETTPGPTPTPTDEETTPAPTPTTEEATPAPTTSAPTTTAAHVTTAAGGSTLASTGASGAALVAVSAVILLLGAALVVSAQVSRRRAAEDAQQG